MVPRSLYQIKHYCRFYSFFSLLYKNCIEVKGLPKAPLINIDLHLVRKNGKRNNWVLKTKFEIDNRVGMIKCCRNDMIGINENTVSG